MADTESLEQKVDLTLGDDGSGDDIIDDDDNSSLGVTEHQQATTEGSELVEMNGKEKVYVADGSVMLTAASKSARSKRTSKVKCSLICEVLLLTPIMLIVIGLFCVPTVFYVLNPSAAEVASVNKTDSLCLEVLPYAGEVCRDTLTSLQTCFSGEASTLNIPTIVDQETGEMDAQSLMSGLNFLQPTEECREAIMPFICLFTFKLCDSSSHLHTVLREECLTLRDDVCASEWRQAEGFLGDGVLPVCEDLPDNVAECVGSSDNTSTYPANLSSTIIVSNSTPSTIENQVSSSSNAPICSEGFFFDDNITNLCRPICGEFDSITLSIVIVDRTCICIGFVACILMFLLATTLQRKSLLVFPSVLFVYMCMTALAMAVMIIIGFFDNIALFCGSKDLVRAIEKGNETPYCTISGVIFNYCIVQICTWAVLHSFFLFWGVAFPFSYRQLRIQKKIRYAHIISVTLALIIPLPSALVPLKDGYVYTTTPTFACAGRNLDITYYTFIIPISILIGMTSCLMVLILWKIFKEFFLKKVLAKKKGGKAGKAQLKISAIIIYYVFLGVTGLVAFTYYEVGDAFRTRVAEYILCESSGTLECELSFDHGVRTLSVLVIVVISFLPVMVILFSCDPKVFKRKRPKHGRGKSFTKSFTRTTTITSQTFKP